jgi:hypothetical protein
VRTHGVINVFTTFSCRLVTLWLIDLLLYCFIGRLLLLLEWYISASQGCCKRQPGDHISSTGERGWCKCIEDRLGWFHCLIFLLILLGLHRRDWIVSVLVLFLVTAPSFAFDCSIVTTFWMYLRLSVVFARKTSLRSTKLPRRVTRRSYLYCWREGLTLMWKIRFVYSTGFVNGPAGSSILSCDPLGPSDVVQTVVRQTYHRILIYRLFTAVLTRMVGLHLRRRQNVLTKRSYLCCWREALK